MTSKIGESFVEDEFEDTSREGLLKIRRKQVIEFGQVVENYADLLKKIEGVMYYDAEPYFHEHFDTNLILMSRKMEMLLAEFNRGYVDDLRKFDLQGELK